MPIVEVYFKETCPFCHRAFALLNSKNVEIKKIDILADPSKRDEMIERTKGRTTVPEIFINGKFIGGCDDLYTLEAKGDLDSILLENLKN